MKSSALTGLFAVAVLLFFVSKASASPNNTQLDFTSITDDPDAISRLNALWSALASNNLSQQQILFCLSQILFESGLLTSLANYGLMNQNNYAGLTNVGGGYASYNSISDFVTAYIGFLSKNNAPINASSLSDFNNRLFANHYYTENTGVYYNGLLTNYNLLTGAQI